MNLYTSQQTKTLDRLAIKEQRLSAFSLMQEAANFSFNALMSTSSAYKYLSEIDLTSIIYLDLKISV